MLRRRALASIRAARDNDRPALDVTWGLTVRPRRTLYALPYPDDVRLLAAVIGRREVTVHDSESFIEATIHHNVVGYVLDAASGGRLQLTEAAHRALTNSHLRRVARTGLLRREASRIAPLIAETTGVTPIFVKGPAIGERFYADWKLRPYADLDLMIPAPALDAVATGLAAEGYEIVEEFRPGYAARFGHDVHVQRHQGATSLDVELHWRIGDDRVGSPLGHATLLRGAERIPVGRTPILTPSRTNQLLIASVHLLSDRARRLAWINDIRLMAEPASADEWRATFETAEAIGGGLLWVFHRALDYVDHYLGLERDRPLPAGPPPPYGPLRAVEELDLAASPHVGRLVALRGFDRLRYLGAVAVPTRAGLEGTVGGDGAGMPALLGRHAGRALRGVMRPQR